MNNKLNVITRVIENVNFKYPDTKIYIEENLNEKTWLEKKKIKKTFFVAGKISIISSRGLKYKF